MGADRKEAQPVEEANNRPGDQPDTDAAGAATESAGRRPIGPQRIEPAATARGKRPLVVAGAVVALLLVAGIGYWLFNALVANSDENQIRDAVGTYTDGLRDGDLAAVRAGTCGDLAQYYADLDDAQFAALHDAGTADGSIPRIDAIDAIRLDTEDSAIVAVTVSTPEDSAGSTRTFDLRREDDRWKVCG